MPTRHASTQFHKEEDVHEAEGRAKSLPSHLENKVTLKKCLGKGPVVIAFFPLAWTPV
jgi:peroxiredoxin